MVIEYRALPTNCLQFLQKFTHSKNKKFEKLNTKRSSIGRCLDGGWFKVDVEMKNGRKIEVVLEVTYISEKNKLEFEVWDLKSHDILFGFATVTLDSDEVVDDLEYFLASQNADESYYDAFDIEYPIALLDMIEVNKHFHRVGVGNFILDTVISTLKDRGFKQLYLQAVGTYHDVHPWYMRKGFSLIYPKSVQEINDVRSTAPILVLNLQD
jgi:GNAT superfamily N-acetyltransferase